MDSGGSEKAFFARRHMAHQGLDDDSVGMSAAATKGIGDIGFHRSALPTVSDDMQHTLKKRLLTLSRHLVVI
jgi:hypothetical protein